MSDRETSLAVLFTGFLDAPDLWTVAAHGALDALDQLAVDSSDHQT